MGISQESFAALVEAAAANRGKVVKVTVDGFGFVLKLASRRSTYDVRAFYDAATNSWTMIDPYKGGTLPSIVSEIARAMKR
jgi:hypothetical protein